MSDALTDISRDEYRNELARNLLIKSSEWIRNPSKELGDELIKIAESCDSIPRGYWNSPTYFKTVTENMIINNDVEPFINLWQVTVETLPYLSILQGGS